MILALDATGPRAGIALLNAAGETLFRRFAETRAGLIETLPLLLAEAIAIAAPESIAVTIGPGSFTGLRTAIALAQGYAAAAAIPLLGVTTAEAYAQAFPGLHRPLWVAIRARKNRIFLLRGATAEAFADAGLPRTRTAVAAAGDAANELAAHLAASGGDVLLTNARAIDPVWAARAALSRQAANLPPHEAQPIYIDPPEAKPSPLRPAPVFDQHRHPFGPVQRRSRGAETFGPTPRRGRLSKSVRAKRSVITRATAAHAATLAEIHATAFPTDSWSATAFTTLMTQPTVHALIHGAGGVILLRTAADEAEILTFAAHPPRQGTGRALLAAAITQAAALGCKAMFLEVAATNTAARALYSSAGFAEAGRRPRYYENGADALIMQRPL